MKNKITRKTLAVSGLSLLLSAGMFAGTTFAWFTDAASTNVNTIVSGNLDVALEMLDAQGNWVSAEGEALTWNRHANASGAMLWEPGCTYQLQTIRVTNNGNLALKYQLSLAGVQGDKKLGEVIQWTVNGVDLDTEFVLLPGESSDAITISAHMTEEAGNEYQNLTLEGAAISVKATQAPEEYDSFTNQYDANAAYGIDTSAIQPAAGKTMTVKGTSAKIEGLSLADAMDALSAAGGQYTISYAGYTGMPVQGEIKLDRDINIGTNNGWATTMSLIVDSNVTIDLNGHKISNAAGVDTGWSGYGVFTVVPGGTLNIIDSAGGGSIDGVLKAIVLRGGDVNLYSGTVTCTQKITNADKAGITTNPTGSNAFVIENQGGTFTQCGGTIEMPLVHTTKSGETVKFLCGDNVKGYAIGSFNYTPDYPTANIIKNGTQIGAYKDTVGSSITTLGGTHVE